MANKRWKDDAPSAPAENRPKPEGELWKIWPYALAFAVMCYVYAGCKLAGLEWAAERPWGEVIAFLCAATLVFAAFALRKRIPGWFAALKKKLEK